MSISKNTVAWAAALFCSVLGWQQNRYENLVKTAVRIKTEYLDCKHPEWNLSRPDKETS